MGHRQAVLDICPGLPVLLHMGNIDVVHGIANDALGYIYHIQFDNDMRREYRRLRDLR